MKLIVETYDGQQNLFDVLKNAKFHRMEVNGEIRNMSLSGLVVIDI